MEDKPAAGWRSRGCVAKQGSCSGRKVRVRWGRGWGWTWMWMWMWKCEVDNNIRDDTNVVSGFACECLTVIKSPHTCRWGETSVQVKQVISRCCFYLRRPPSQATVDCVERRFEVIIHQEAWLRVGLVIMVMQVIADHVSIYQLDLDLSLRVFDRLSSGNRGTGHINTVMSFTVSLGVDFPGAFAPAISPQQKQ